MKRLFALLAAIFLCLPLVSCELDGIGNERGREEDKDHDILITSPLIESGTLSAETEPIGEMILVDWMDFVRVNGESYDGGFENRVLEESRVGEKLGEILYRVKSSYSSHEEMNAASSRDFTAAFRPVGCEIFAVKDDENSIAVLDGGKYYLYTSGELYSVPFSAFGGEGYFFPGTDGTNRGASYNTFLQLCEAWGGAENIPANIKERYSGNAFSDITLVVVELVGSWGGVEFGIGSVSKKNDDLYVKAYELESAIADDEAIHTWTFFIEIPKTDNKKVEVAVEACDPLAVDPSLRIVTYEELVQHNVWVPGEDYGRYEGGAVLNKYAAEELLRGLYDYTPEDIAISYNPTYNYWITRHTRRERNGIYSVYTVIRVADGRNISQWEEPLVLPE